MIGAAEVNHDELRRYTRRIGERWPLEQAMLGGARVDDLHGAGVQRERGPEFVLVLVSGRFDGVPWLERVHQASALWDADEMGDRVEVHCYTPVELDRKMERMPRVRRTVERGLDLLAD